MTFLEAWKLFYREVWKFYPELEYKPNPVIEENGK